MKFFKPILAFAIVAFAIASCNQKEVVTPEPQNDDGYLKTGVCGTTFFTLFDGDDNPAGTLKIWNAVGTTYFRFMPTTFNPNDVVTLTINGTQLPAPKSGPSQGGWYTLYQNTYVTGYVDGLGPCGNTFSFVATFGDLSATGEYTFDCCVPLCYGDDDETAWAAGTLYVPQGNWATYTPYTAGSTNTVILWAGQNMNAGTVTFQPAPNNKVKITIALNNDWGFNPNESENVKIQDYMTTPPSKNPAPGKFTWKSFAANVTPNVYEVTVPSGNYYGVHVDVVGAIPCE